MSDPTVLDNEETRMEVEDGGWLILRRPERDASGATPDAILTRTAQLPGNWRLIPGPHGAIERLAEIPVEDEGGEGMDGDRFHRLRAMPAGEESLPPEEVVTAALDAAGLAWSRREGGWAVPATSDRPGELRVRRVPGGVRVEAVLVEWDEAEPKETAGLARFLFAAQASLRFARCELNSHGACVISHAETVRLETDLGHSLRAVAAGCRLLTRAARALAAPEVARRYLRFHEAADNG
ncbi:MAG TPA: hypothetical protein VN688_31495 [Gemmataceae bacterium]|nr:hypothetical protein [Gemmataceae bacterium]